MIDVEEDDVETQCAEGRQLIGQVFLWHFGAQREKGGKVEKKRTKTWRHNTKTGLCTPLINCGGRCYV